MEKVVPLCSWNINKRSHSGGEFYNVNQNPQEFALLFDIAFQPLEIYMFRK